MPGDISFSEGESYTPSETQQSHSTSHAPYQLRQNSARDSSTSLRSTIKKFESKPSSDIDVPSSSSLVIRIKQESSSGFSTPAEEPETPSQDGSNEALYHYPPLNLVRTLPIRIRPDDVPSASSNIGTLIANQSSQIPARVHDAYDDGQGKQDKWLEADATDDESQDEFCSAEKEKGALDHNSLWRFYFDPTFARENGSGRALHVDKDEEEIDRQLAQIYQYNEYFGPTACDDLFLGTFSEFDNPVEDTECDRNKEIWEDWGSVLAGDQWAIWEDERTSGEV